MRRKVVHEHTGKHLVSRDSFVTLDRSGDGVVDTHELLQASAETVHGAVDHVMIGKHTMITKTNIVGGKYIYHTFFFSLVIPYSPLLMRYFDLGAMNINGKSQKPQPDDDEIVPKNGYHDDL